MLEQAHFLIFLRVVFLTCRLRAAAGRQRGHVGNNATLSRDVIARQQIVRQLSDSGLNAVLVAPQLALDAQDSSAGRFWSAGGFASSRCLCSGRVDGRLQKRSLLKHIRRNRYDNDS